MLEWNSLKKKYKKFCMVISIVLTKN
jgi:hypothetical protein